MFFNTRIHIALTLLLSSIHLSYSNVANFESKIPPCKVPGLAGTSPLQACIVIKRCIEENAKIKLGPVPSEEYNHKNVLLFEGPTGIGKTTLAKAIAKETDSHFVMIQCPHVLNKYIGGTKDSVNEKIEIAIAEGDAYKKRVVILFDEIDKLASTDKSSAHNEYDAAMSAIWCSMDKYINNPRVLFIFTTNHWNRLPLEFKNRIGRNVVSMKEPDALQREKLLQHYSLKLTKRELKEYCSDEYIGTLIKETEKFSIRDIADIYFTAQEYASFQNIPLTQEHLAYALHVTKISVAKQNEPTEEELEKQRTRKREEEQDNIQQKLLELQKKNIAMQNLALRAQLMDINTIYFDSRYKWHADFFKKYGCDIEY